jgi:hypothetical protein
MKKFHGAEEGRGLAQEWTILALTEVRKWVERFYVLHDAKFELLVVGSSETRECRRLYFKIQYANGEINEGNIFEAKYDKTRDRTLYTEFTVDGFLE